MTDLIAAAKAVIYDWDKYQNVQHESVNMLCAAVERAEKREAVGFAEWWESTGKRYWPYKYSATQDAWTAAKRGERGRIKDIVAELLDPVDPWIHYSTLLERIDELDDDGGEE